MKKATKTKRSAKRPAKRPGKRPAPSHLSAFRQRHPYDCGVSAVYFYLTLLGASGISYDACFAQLRPTPEYGVPPATMFNVLSSFSSFRGEVCISDSTRRVKDIPVPSICNVESYGDGHYVVVVAVTRNHVVYFNPSGGDITSKTHADFMLGWYSPRSSKHLAIYIQRPGEPPVGTYTFNVNGGTGNGRGVVTSEGEGGLPNAS